MGSEDVKRVGSEDVKRVGSEDVKREGVVPGKVWYLFLKFCHSGYDRKYYGKISKQSIYLPPPNAPPKGPDLDRSRIKPTPTL
jgi:hypothetical protein